MDKVMRMYLVILDYGTSTVYDRIIAETYWEAVNELKPGNNVVKLEVIELGEISFIRNDLDIFCPARYTKG